MGHSQERHHFLGARSLSGVLAALGLALVLTGCPEDETEGGGDAGLEDLPSLDGDRDRGGNIDSGGRDVSRDGGELDATDTRRDPDAEGDADPGDVPRDGADAVDDGGGEDAVVDSLDDADGVDSPDGSELPDAGSCIDEDGDGHGEGCAAGADCDDTDPLTFFGAPQVCDGNDNTCTGAEVPDDELDGDGDHFVECLGWSDGQGDDGDILGGGDCDDEDGAAYPGVGTCELRYAYTESFELSRGGWRAGGVASSWEYGVPAGEVIDGAARGERAWVTNLVGPYNDDESSHLTSPRFDFGALESDPVLRFQHFRDLESFDGVWMEVSLDDGETWERLGAFDEGLGWYNDRFDQWWSDTGEGWTVSEQTLDGVAGERAVRLRFVLDSDGSNALEGFGVDDISIFGGIVDATVEAIDLTSTGCGLRADNQVVATVRNVGTEPFAAMTLELLVDGEVVASEVSDEGLERGEVLVYPFVATVDLADGEDHEVGVRVLVAGDGNADNDLLAVDTAELPGFSGLPYREGFEAGDGGWVAYGEASSWARGMPTGATIRSAGEGEYAWVTNPAGSYNDGEFSYLESPCLDLSSFSGGDPLLTFQHNYQTESCCDEGWVEVSVDGGESWEKVRTNPSAVNWYNNTSSQYWNGNSSGWRQASIRLPGVAGYGDVRLRFVLSTDGSVTYDGFAVDAVEVRGVTSGALTNLEVPRAGCALGSAEAAVATIVNDGTEPIVGGSIRLQVDGEVVATETLPRIVGGATYRHEFGLGLDLSAPGTHTLSAVLLVPGDESDGNDSVARNVASVANEYLAPFTTSFEDGPDGWTTSGSNRTWALGRPQGLLIDEAADGEDAWVTNLTGSYANNERSYLQSPCMNLGGLSRDPLITFAQVFETESCCDHGWLEVSYDRGVTWSKVPAGADSRGWYNDASGERWNGSSGGWQRLRARLVGAAGRGAVLLRFAFQSDGSGTREGFAVDDLAVGAAEQDDVAISSVEVSTSGCQPGSAEAVTVAIENRGTRTAPGVFVALSVDGTDLGRERVEVSLPPGEVVSVELARTVDVSAPGPHDVRARVIGLSDSVPSNDELSTTVYNYSTRTALPAFEGFEGDAGGWVAGGTNSSWERAVPADTLISEAAGGRYAWVTDADSNYPSNEDSWVESTCYDLRDIDEDPVLTLAQIFQTESCCDELWLEMSLDDGEWARVEASADALNWYDEESDGWAGNSGGWRAARTVLAGAAGHTARLRMRFDSDGSLTYEGFAFDEIVVSEGDFIDIGVEQVELVWDGCGPTAETRVEATLRNRGVADAEDVSVVLRLGDTVVVTETLDEPVPASEELVYVFTTTLDLSANGAYDVRVEALLDGDEIPSNDELSRALTNYGGPGGLPYMSGFELDGGGLTVGGSNTSWARGEPNDSNIRNAGSGRYAWVTNPTGDYNVGENSFLYSPCFDLQDETADLRVAFLHNYYTESCCDEGWLDVSVDGGESWSRVVASEGAEGWYNDTSNRWWDGTSSGWRNASVVVPDVAGAERVQLRFGFSSDGSTQHDGFGIDELVIRLDEDPDLGLSNLSLAAERCSYTSSELVSVTVNNEGNTLFEAASLRLVVDGEAVATESFPPPAVGGSYRHTFARRADLFEAGEHTIEVELVAADDITPENDAVSRTVVSNGGLTALPYSESFEDGEAGWQTSGTNSTWERGMPSTENLSGASDGDWAWVTNADGDYALEERSLLESPCFDFLDEVGDAVVSFDYQLESERCCDHAWLEVSLDGGRSWAKVAGGEAAANWYNDVPNQWWEGSSGGWVTASTRLSGVGGRGDVRFRFVFESDTSEAREGLAIDRFRTEVE